MFRISNKSERSGSIGIWVDVERSSERTSGLVYDSELRNLSIVKIISIFF